MKESAEYQINTKTELIDLFASDVIDNHMLNGRLLDAIIRETRTMIEESLRKILPYEANNINWDGIANEVGIKGSTDSYLVIKNILNDIIVEILKRHELTNQFTSQNALYLPEKKTINKAKLEILMD
jgi:hypothetical protein